MIPEQLVLKNFLSYRDISLSFRGLQTACICGANGAGKSSLLEAMAWSIWGKSRASTEDDVIYAGEMEATVDFIFRFGRDIYRVIRSRRLGQATVLEFQIAINESDEENWSFRSLTERGVKATQSAILQRLRLDYDTFVNSAYLRQGRADEFMLKTPADRKQILADLLKLSQYDELAEQAREQSKTLKTEIKYLDDLIESHEAKLTGYGNLESELLQVEHTLVDLRNNQQTVEAELDRLRSAASDRQTQLQQITWIQQQQGGVEQELARLAQEMQRLDQRQNEVDRVLADKSAIEAGIQQLQRLQQEEEILGKKSQQYHQLSIQRSQAKQELDQTIHRIQNEQKNLSDRLADLTQQAKEQQAILSQRSSIEAGLAQFQAAKLNLETIEQLQAQAAPLVQRQQVLIQECDRVRSRLGARLEEVQNLCQRTEANLARESQLAQQWQQLDAQIQHLQNRKVYQERVQEKGTERKSFIDRLTGMKVDLENRLDQLLQKSQLLTTQTDSQAGVIGLPGAEYGQCPLCDRPLDQHHLDLVRTKQQTEEQEIRDQLWVLQEQLTLTEREIQILRQEYRDLKQELNALNGLIEERGKLQEQMQTLQSDRLALQESQQAIAQLSQTLAWLDRTGAPPQKLPDFARSLPDFLNELTDLEQQLADLQFDERNLSLARAELERWRWVELKQYELNQAQQKYDQLQQRRPILIAEQEQLQQTLEQLTDPSQPESLAAQIDTLDQQIIALNYQHEDYESLRTQLRASQVWLTRAETLRQYEQEAPQLSDRRQQLIRSQATQTAVQDQLNQQLSQLQQQLAMIPDPGPQIQPCELQLNDLRQHIESTVAHQAKLSQQQEFLNQLAEQVQQDRLQRSQKQHQQRVYDELAKAFGKNGIQALAIETLLPQLEAEANRILSQLSANQLHINFVTQRLKKTATKRQKAADLTSVTIETLDIQIADSQGTRPYETYSGGESFRINFSIRLALSRLLTQRSGTALQLLIIDEGFGTQDEAGCDRLVAAINAIAPDFGCILTVTHIPQLKEAFTARIEVYKTGEGSKVSIVL